jgi:DNA-binding NarL/FixJ family response regulator
MTTRIVVVDSNPILRLGLKELLRASVDLLIVGEASRCSDGCNSISASHPDIVVFDVELEDASGAEVIRHFRERFPDVRAIIYTDRQEPEFVTEATTCQIQGFVLKKSPMHRLGDAIQFVASGMSYLDPAITAVVLAQLSTSPPEEKQSGLSVKELSVLRLVAAGKSNKEIAKALCITERTVKFYVSSILRRLEARNRTHAVRIAEAKQLLSRVG